LAAVFKAEWTRSARHARAREGCGFGTLRKTVYTVEVLRVAPAVAVATGSATSLCAIRAEVQDMCERDTLHTIRGWNARIDGQRGEGDRRWDR